MANRLKKKDSPTSLAFSNDDVKILTDKISECSDVTVKEKLLNVISCNSNGKDQLCFLKELINFLKKNDNDLEKEVANILCWLFVFCKSKHPVRRAFASFMASLQDEYSCKVVSAFSEVFEEILQFTKEICCNVIRKNIDMISALMENFPKGEKVIITNCKFVMNFLDGAIKRFIEMSRKDKSPILQTESMHNCLTAFKTLIAVLQKRQQVQPSLTYDDGNQTILASVVNSAMSVIDDENVLLECRNAAAMVMLSVLLHYPESSMHHFVNTLQHGGDDHKSVELKQENNSDVDRLIIRSLCLIIASSTNISSVIVVLHALLVKVPSSVLHKQLNDQGSSTLFQTLLIDRLIQISVESTDKNTMVLTFKTLSLWVAECSSVIIKNNFGLSASYNEVLINKLLPDLIMYVDHSIDTIRHNVTAALKDCFVTMSKTSNYQQINIFCRKYFQSDMKSRGKLSVLSNLCEFVNIEDLLSTRPTFPTQLVEFLSDVDLAPHACNLYRAASEKHLNDIHYNKEDCIKWETTWLDCLQSGLSDPRKEIQANIANYIVPALIKVNPAVIKNLLHQLKNDDTTFMKFRLVVVFLKAARSMKNVKLEGFEKISTSHQILKVNGFDSDASRRDSEALPYSQNICLSSETTCLWKGLLDMKHLKNCFTCIDEQARLDVLSLVCNSAKTTDLIDDDDITLVKLFLQYNMAIENPSFRQQTTLCVKKLLVRLFAHSYQLNKTQNNSKDLFLEKYRAFLTWFIDFLFGRLHLSAAYCQVSHSLELISLVKTMFDENQGSTIFSPKDFSIILQNKGIYTKKLLHCFHDTYDPNRMLVLNLFLRKDCLFLTEVSTEDLKELFKDVLKNIFSPQPDLSSVAAYQLCYISLVLTEDTQITLMKIAKEHLGISFIILPCELFVIDLLMKLLHIQLDVLKSSLIKASQNAPVHNVLFALRLVFQLHGYDLKNSIVKSHEQFFTNFLKDFVNYGLEIIDLVSPYVSNEAPEGQLCDVNLSEVYDLMNSNSTNSTEDVVLQAHIARMILVCCWRSMKEVSLLLGTCVYNFSSVQAEETILSKAAIIDMWEMFSNILLRSKHAGAYELASVGFLKICSVLWISSDAELREFPTSAVRTLVADLLSEEAMESGQVTRRSAGLPFYLQCLCATEPPVKTKESFKYLMTSLTRLCMAKLNTHDINKIIIALNILRAFYKDAKLCENVLPYISNGVVIALRGFSSSLWPIRNSCTLLFSSLMQRIFGVKKFKMTGREFFSRYPSLYQFLLDQANVNDLRNGSSDTANPLNPSIYPVLLLLSHLYSSTIEGTDTVMKLDRFIPPIMICASNPVYKTRTMCSNALVPLIPINKIESTLEMICSNMLPQKQPELQRQQPELQRQQPELQRQQPELKRQQPELQRQQPELQRQQPELQRQQPELQRQQHERQRQQHELQRQQPELQRQQPERQRQQPELQRQQPELQRQQHKQNLIHGSLLQIKNLLSNLIKRRANQLRNSDCVNRTLERILWVYIDRDINFVAKSVFLEIVIMQLEYENDKGKWIPLLKSCIESSLNYYTGSQNYTSKPGYTLCLRNIIKLLLKLMNVESYRELLCSVVAENCCDKSYIDNPSNVVGYFLKSPDADVVLDVLEGLHCCTSDGKFNNDFENTFYEMVIECSGIDRKFPKLLHNFVLWIENNIDDHQLTALQYSKVHEKCLNIPKDLRKDDLKLAMLKIFHLFLEDCINKPQLDAEKTNRHSPEMWRFFEECSSPENCETVREEAADLLSSVSNIEEWFGQKTTDVYSYFQCAINLLNDADCEIRDAAALSIHRAFQNSQEPSVETFYIPQSQVVMEVLFTKSLYKKMVDEPCNCILFLLCVICQVSFYNVFDRPNNITSVSAEKKNDANQNEELYKRFVVFEKGKDNPYWNEKYIYELVVNILQMFMRNYPLALQLNEARHELRKHINNLQCLLDSHGKGEADTYKYFLVCKKMIFS